MSKLTPLVIPCLSEHTATLIFLHGRGDTGFGWKDSFESELNNPHVKVILPHAPTRKIQRFNGASMPAWFDSKALSWDGGDVVEHVEQSRKTVFDLIDAEVKAGILPERIMVGGFSQGAAMSLFSGLTYHRQLAGIIALSGFLVQPTRFPGECQANKSTPIFFGCGDSDDVVPYKEMMKRSADYIQDFHGGLEFHVYRNLGHSVTHQVSSSYSIITER